MRFPRAVPVVTVLVAAAFAFPTGVTAATTAPTRAQIRAALKQAEASKNLWATFNICGPTEDPDWVGVRGEMPALSFPTRMRLVVSLSAFSANAHTYVPVPGSFTERLGIHTAGALVQQGVRVSFIEPVTVIGHVTFEWFRDGKLLGETTKATAQGIKRVGDADPAGYSVSTCSVS